VAQDRGFIGGENAQDPGGFGVEVPAPNFEGGATTLLYQAGSRAEQAEASADRGDFTFADSNLRDAQNYALQLGAYDPVSQARAQAWVAAATAYVEAKRPQEAALKEAAVLADGAYVATHTASEADIAAAKKEAQDLARAQAAIAAGFSPDLAYNGIPDPREVAVNATKVIGTLASLATSTWTWVAVGVAVLVGAGLYAKFVLKVV
jgi:hypothetical protein